MSVKTIERTIERDFIDKVSEEIQLSADGKDRFLVLTPFHFNDGDQLVIVLKKMGNRWVLSDEAHTYMHLSYYMDEQKLHSGNRQKLILKALSMFQVEDYDGELIIDVSDGCYGEALYDFAQALLKIIDVTYLSRERVQSTFIDDFQAFLYQKVELNHITFNWQHPTNDPDGIYKVDCRINGKIPPLFVFALNSDTKTQAAAITLHQLKSWGVNCQPVGIFERENATTRDVFLRFKDVCDTYFTDIIKNGEQIEQYLQDYISGEA